MKIAFLGGSQIGWLCCQTLYEMGQNIGMIVCIPQTFKISWSPTPVTNLLFKSFDDLAKKQRTPLFYFTGTDSLGELRKKLLELEPDLIMVIGWYYRIPESILKLPPLGTVGIHGSLLPKYRGGAPLVWAMINGEKRTGVSLFYLNEGIDSGDIIGQREIEIEKTDYISNILAKATRQSVQLIQQYIPLIPKREAPRIPQDERKATRVPQRVPADGLIDWQSKTASEAYNWVRAQSRPYPGAFTFAGGDKIIIWKASVSNLSQKGMKPGTLWTEYSRQIDCLGVWCADERMLEIEEVEFDNKTRTGGEFARDKKLKHGELLIAPNAGKQMRK